MAFVLPAVLLVSKSSAQNNNVLNPGKYEMTFYLLDGGQLKQYATFTKEIVINDDKTAIYTVYHKTLANTDKIDTIISNSATLAPIYHAQYNPSPGGDFVLHYGNEVTGYYFDKSIGKRTAIKDPSESALIDGNYLSSYLTALPLTSGYKKSFDVYAFSPGSRSNIKRYNVNEVKTSLYTSQLTGEHPVWQVTVIQDGSPDITTYYIEKSKQRVWKIEIVSNGQTTVVLDNEIDYNPFHTTFNKEESLRMVNNGSATIDGQAFARDNANTAGIQGVAVLNVNKKQCAPAGTSIILIPYTDFFKEWFALNDAARKKGKSVPLPKEAATCIKTTTVYDNDGHFEFTNLMPGDYMLMTQFTYSHSTSKTEVTGYTDTYIDGAYVGTSPNTTTYNYNVGNLASVKKVVTIKLDGEKLTMKLKKTL